MAGDVRQAGALQVVQPKGYGIDRQARFRGHLRHRLGPSLQDLQEQGFLVFLGGGPPEGGLVSFEVYLLMEDVFPLGELPFHVHQPTQRYGLQGALHRGQRQPEPLPIQGT